MLLFVIERYISKSIAPLIYPFEFQIIFNITLTMKVLVCLTVLALSAHSMLFPHSRINHQTNVLH